jgi:AcrR family transcriptional regulator
VNTTNVLASDTRARILAVALELIAEKGFAATSTRELSERLGFTKAALYYHFHTKDELLIALVEPGIQQFRDVLDRVSTPGDAGRRELLDGYLTLVINNLDVTRLLSRDPAISRIEALSRVTEPLYQELIDRLIGNQAGGASNIARAHVALGGIHAALLNHEPDADTSEVRRGAFTAACGALGL